MCLEEKNRNSNSVLSFQKKRKILQKKRGTSEAGRNSSSSQKKIQNTETPLKSFGSGAPNRTLTPYPDKIWNPNLVIKTRMNIVEWKGQLLMVLL